MGDIVVRGLIKGKGHQAEKGRASYKCLAKQTNMMTSRGEDRNLERRSSKKLPLPVIATISDFHR